MSATTVESVVAPAHRSLWYRLYNGETNFEFVRRWKRWALISGTFLLVGLITLVASGLKLGIDFKGGTVWEVERNGLSVEKTRSVIAKYIDKNSVVQIVGGDKIRVRGEKSDDALRNQVAQALATAAKVKADEVNITFVGPSWGKDVSSKARNALIVFFIVISIYIALRFQWKMAVAALAAVAHDVLITVGIYALVGKLFGIEVSPATVIAFLTILGFSLYDTIVVFDKVAENEKAFANTGKLSYTDVVNLSMNQVLMRSLNTSFVAVLPVLSLLILGAGIMGATALGDFGLALFIGLLTGAYSSIFVASPILAMLKEREELWAGIRKRLSKGGDDVTADAGAAARASVSAGAAAGSVNVANIPPAVFSGSNPRGRKQGRVR
jgi:preprotein translocase subunit SecF